MTAPPTPHRDSSRVLPHLDKQVLRMGVAGNYGLETNDIHHAAEQGVNMWLWSSRFKTVTPALRKILAKDRDRHVVAAFVSIGYSSTMVRRSVEKSLRLLAVDHIDLVVLAWLGRATALTRGVEQCLQALKNEGKVKVLGTSIHDRVRAGQLAHDSVLDALMIRYNAKHPGAEHDVFPHLQARDPVVMAYTATSWGQLLRPIPSIEMPPWPGDSNAPFPPPLTAQMCYRFCLTNPQVHVVWTAPKNRTQLDENLTALQMGPLPAEQQTWIREYGRQVKARKKFAFI